MPGQTSRRRVSRPERFLTIEITNHIALHLLQALPLKALLSHLLNGRFLFPGLWIVGQGHLLFTRFFALQTANDVSDDLFYPVFRFAGFTPVPGHFPGSLFRLFLHILTLRLFRGPLCQHFWRKRNVSSCRLR
jgi:hypothetical protein